MDNEYIIFIEEEDQPYSDIVVTDDKYLYLSGLVSETLETRDEAYGTIEFEISLIQFSAAPRSSVNVIRLRRPRYVKT